MENYLLVIITGAACLAMCGTVILMAWWVITRALPELARQHAMQITHLVESHSRDLDQQGRRYQEGLAAKVQAVSDQMENLTQNHLYEIEKATRATYGILREMQEKNDPRMQP